MNSYDMSRSYYNLKRAVRAFTYHFDQKAYIHIVRQLNESEVELPLSTSIQGPAGTRDKSSLFRCDWRRLERELLWDWRADPVTESASETTDAMLEDIAPIRFRSKQDKFMGRLSVFVALKER